MEIDDVGTVQHYSMWLSGKKHTHNRKNKYCIVMQFIMYVFFDSIKTINLIKLRGTINSRCASGTREGNAIPIPASLPEPGSVMI